MPPKKKKTSVIKPMNTKIQGYKQPLNFNVEKALKPNKINPKEIFDMKDVPKGSHRMPDGSIMKNKDMKKKKKKKTTKTTKY
tara:strand:+ start:198 stop:443 length:246 start_codon:yes stop_codon:yes gene_type:complete